MLAFDFGIERALLPFVSVFAVLADLVVAYYVHRLLVHLGWRRLSGAARAAVGVSVALALVGYEVWTYRALVDYHYANVDDMRADLVKCDQYPPFRTNGVRTECDGLSFSIDRPPEAHAKDDFVRWNTNVVTRVFHASAVYTIAAALVLVAGHLLVYRVLERSSMESIRELLYDAMQQQQQHHTKRT
jgi:hypothetical protein